MLLGFSNFFFLIVYNLFSDPILANNRCFSTDISDQVLNINHMPMPLTEENQSKFWNIAYFRPRLSNMIGVYALAHCRCIFNKNKIYQVLPKVFLDLSLWGCQKS